MNMKLEIANMIMPGSNNNWYAVPILLGCAARQETSCN